MFARRIGACALSLFLVSATAARATAAADTVDSTAVADETAQPGTNSAPSEAAAKKGWEFATIGYVWAAGAWGKTDVIGPADPVDLDLPFGKVLDAFKFAFMGSAEAKRDRLVFLGDLTFIHLGATEGIGIRDPDFLEAELDSRTAEVTLVGGYRVVDKGPVSLDLLAGGRMNFLKMTLQLEGPNREADGEVKHNWLDPLIGARVAAPLGGRWSFGFYGDVGGIVTGSDITWQAAPTINYQLNHRMTLGGGWRYYKVKFDKGDFLYNVHQSGPIVTFRTVF